VKVQDETFSRRQAAKLKDRGRNRRFDDEESAILDEDVMSAKEAKKAKKAAKRQARKELIPIFLPQFISVENLASVLGVRVEKFATQLKEMGFTETSNDHVLGAEEAGLIAGEYGYEPMIDKGHEIDLKQMYFHSHQKLITHRV
jgi:translation initiation factor IF-2